MAGRVEMADQVEFDEQVRDDIWTILSRKYNTVRRGGHPVDTDEHLRERTFWPDMRFHKVESIAVSLVERDYDDELITEDEIRAMIDERVHEEATEDDIARIAHLLEEAGVNVDPHVPGAAH